MLRIVIKNGKWVFVATILLGLVALGVVFRTIQVLIPFLTQLTPVPVMVAVIIPVLAVVPLYSSFALIESTLPRAKAMRAVTVIAAILASVLGVEGMAAAAEDATRFPLKVAYFLIASGPCAVVVIGELAWLVPIILGFASLVIGNGYVVQRFADPIPTPIIAATLATSAALYWHFGARESRHARRPRLAVE